MCVKRGEMSQKMPISIDGLRFVVVPKETVSGTGMQRELSYISAFKESYVIISVSLRITKSFCYVFPQSKAKFFQTGCILLVKDTYLEESSATAAHKLEKV